MHNFQPLPPQKNYVGDVAVGVFIGLWLFTITVAFAIAVTLAATGRHITTVVRDQGTTPEVVSP